jgi:hypothetical protein
MGRGGVRSNQENDMAPNDDDDDGLDDYLNEEDSELEDSDLEDDDDDGSWPENDDE